MRFNVIGFVLSDIIARNRGVPPATAMRDGLLGGVLVSQSPILAVALTSVISQNQESSGSGASILPSAPVVTAVAILYDNDPHVLLTWSTTENAKSYKVHKHPTAPRTRAIPD